MPPGKKAPPQQSSLAGWLGGKQKKKDVAATSSDKGKGIIDDHSSDACPPSDRASGSIDPTVAAAASPTKRKSTPVPAVGGSNSDSGKSPRVSAACPLHFHRAHATLRDSAVVPRAAQSKAEKTQDGDRG